MHAETVRKILCALGVFLSVWLGLKFLLPVLLPFLLGALIALAAEPAVSFGVYKCRLPRGLSAGLGVAATLLLLVTVVSLAGALAVKELGSLAGKIPDIQQTTQQGILLLQDWLIGVSQRTPDGVRPLLEKTVLDFFGSGSAILKQVTGRLPGMVTGLLGRIPDSALGIGTGILAGFMISARLPRIKSALAKRLPVSWYEKYLPALKRMRTALGGWLKAQLKLMCVTYLIITAGFLMLGISYGPLWAVLVALVDAVPMLGTGTVLIPWAIVALLQGNMLQTIGLLGVYGAAMLTRTVLEPRLVGKQLGLDPLVTLLFFYVGYRFWGLPGMLLAPMAAAAAKSLTEAAG